MLSFVMATLTVERLLRLLLGGLPRDVAVVVLDVSEALFALEARRGDPAEASGDRDHFVGRRLEKLDDVVEARADRGRVDFDRLKPSRRYNHV